MEKSMVHQLNFLASSNVHFSRASFIHTSQEPEYGQLRKSRIQNLPNYKRQDLSGKLNFVVVFQGIQIERLSVEIETLRMKNKDYERQIGNYQNYQVQIRQLTQKCHSYQVQRQDHQEAMQKMHRICQQLYNELQQMKNRYADIDTTLKEKYRLEKQRTQSLTVQIQKWKARYHAAQNSKFKQLEDMRMNLECQRKSMLQREIRQITIKYQSQRTMLQGELRKLREYIEGRNAEINRLQINLSQSQIRQSQLRQYEGRLEEYEDKLMMMAQQNLRLNELLRMKKEQIQNLKQNQRGLSDKINSFKRIQDQFNQVNRRIQSYENQIKEWSLKYSKLEVQNNKNLILSQKSNQYERLLDNSAEEMERMNTIIRQKLSEIQRWKSQNQRLSIQLEQSKQTQTKISEYQQKICSISMENQRLSELLKNRLGEIQQWKLKYSDIESRIVYLNQSQIKAKQLESRLVNQVNGKNQLMQRINRFEVQIKRFSQSDNKLNQEMQNNQELHKQIQRLNISIRVLSTENNDFKKKYSILQNQIKQNSGLMNELNDYKKRIIFMTQQIDRINGVIHERTQQIRQLKENYKNVNVNATKYRTIEEQLVNNIKQTQTLVLKLDQSRRQNQCAQQKILGLQSAYSRLQSQVMTLNEEREKLVNQINLKKVQIGEYLSKIEVSESKIRQYQVIEKQYQTIQKNMEISQKKFKDIEARYSYEVKRGENLSAQIENLSSQILKIRAQSNFSKQFVSEYTVLKSQSSEKDKQISYLMQRIASIQKIIVLLKQENIKTYNNMCLNHQKWMSVGQNLDGLTVFMDKMFEMSSKIQNLSQENLQLESSMRLMNVQMVQSSYPDCQSSRQSLQVQSNAKIASQQRINQKSEPIIFTANNQHQYQNIQNKTTQIYESQATSNYSPTQYSYISSYGSNIDNTRPQSTITVKTISPITHESTTYTYGNNIQNSGDQSERVHYNYHVSTVSTGDNSKNFTKGYKYSSQINTSPQMISRQSQGRRFVLSPVRFLN